MKYLTDIPMYATPEEKLSVFGHENKEVVQQSEPPNLRFLNEKQQEQYLRPNVKTVTDIISMIEFPDDFSDEDKQVQNQIMQDKVSTSDPEYKQTSGKTYLNLSKNLPEPQTMMRNLFKKNQKLRETNITKEIDALNIDDQDKIFLKRLQQLESNGNWQIVNQYGYKGLYQFGKTQLKGIGMSDEDYMQNTANQHLAALKLKQANLKSLKKYVGQVIDGISLTENNLAAAAHLVGQGSVKQWIESNGTKVRVDGNNVPLTAYLLLFK